MADTHTGRWTRRRAVAVGLGGLAGGMVASAQAQAFRPMLLRGIAGGGLVRTPEGQADFSLFATRLILDEADAEPTSIIGQIRWVDPGALLTLESAEISAYGPIEGEERGREIRGTLTVNGADTFPFLMEVVDVGPPGSGEDTVTLYVGDAVPDTAGATPIADTGFSYQATGTVEAGDVQLLSFDVEIPASDA